MTSYQDIEIQITEVTKKVAELAFMNREQIFGILAEIVNISDQLTNFIRDMDRTMAEVESRVVAGAAGEKINASMLSVRVKAANAPLKSDKEWAERQLSLMSELRMAALAAQRSAE